MIEEIKQKILKGLTKKMICTYQLGLKIGHADTTIKKYCEQLFNEGLIDKKVIGYTTFWRKK